MLKSLEPPSWIQFLADGPWWVQVLGASAALYVAEIVRGAAKSTIQALSTARSPLNSFSSTLKKLRKTLGNRTSMVIGLPVPTDNFGTMLKLRGDTVAELEFQVALFVHHVPALMKLIESENLSEQRVLGAVVLKLLDDGGLEVRWVDEAAPDKERRVVFRLG